MNHESYAKIAELIEVAHASELLRLVAINS